MIWTKLRIDRIPGIHRPFETPTFVPGVNFVFGSNGSGKTTLCRALSALLWPETTALDGAVLAAEFDHEGAVWRVERTGSLVTWFVNGQRTLPPPLPGAEWQRCFLLDDVALMSERDPSLALAITRQMAGGIDLRAIGEEWFPLPGPRAFLEARSRWREAQRRQQVVRGEQMVLLRQEERLAELAEQRDAAADARTLLIRLEEARELAQARRALNEIEIAQAEFPPGLQNLTGREGEEWAELAQARQRTEKERDELGRLADEADQKLIECRLPAGPPDEAALHDLMESLSQLSAGEAQLERLELEEARQEARASAARRELAPFNESAKLPAPGPAALARVEQLFAEGGDLQAEQARLRAELKVLGPADASQDPERIREACRILRAWLKAPASLAALWSTGRVLAAAGGAALLVAGGLLAWLVHPALGGMALVGLLCVFWAWPRRPAGAAPRLRSDWQAEYRKSGEAPPARWEPEEIEAYLECIERRLVAALAAAERHNRAERIQHDLEELEARALRWEERRRELAAELGMELGAGAGALARFLDLLARCHEAEALLEDARAQRRTWSARRDERVNHCQKVLAAFGEPPGGSEKELRQRVERLRRRTADFHQAQAQQREAAARSAQVGRERQEIAAKMERLLAHVQLAEDQIGQLESRLEVLPRWRSVEEARKNAQHLVRVAEQRLADRPDLAGLGAEDVAARIEELDGQARRWEALTQEILGIEARIQDETKGQRLMTALFEENAALEHLRAQREGLLLNTAGRFLIGQVLAEYEANSQPAVLRRAGELFSAFTNRTFELIFERSSQAAPEFRARETASGNLLDLEQLSLGTRTQLLLAARLAFADLEAQRFKPPLLLDEALGHSDPRRFQAAAQSLFSLAREGQQSIYFSCQESDRFLLERGRDAAHDPPLNVIDLDEVRFGSRAQVDPLPVPPVRSKLPAPEGVERAEYAAILGVPRLEPSAPVTAAHLFFITADDLPALHAFLEKGVSTIGQFLALERWNVGLDSLKPVVVRRWRARASALAQFQEAFDQGRGRRVDRSALEKCPCISEAFINRISDLARDLVGDPRQLLDALRQKKDPRARGFREDALAGLEAFLEDQGFIDRRPVLELPAILERVIAGAGLALAAKDLEVDEVTQLVHEWWNWCRHPERGPNGAWK